jgi:hypothetical protein
MQTRSLLSSFAHLSILALSACGGHAASSDMASQDETGNEIVGHFVLAPGGADRADVWVEEMNLHVDGVFEANFGSDVSNLSGHHFLAGGTYVVDAKSSTIHFSYDGPNAWNSWRFKAVAGGIELATTDSDFGTQPTVRMNHAASPVTLHFAADGSASADGALVPGATVLVNYAVSRSHCRGKDAAVSPLFMVDNGPVQGPGWAFPPPVNGQLNQMMMVPSGHEIELWFVETDGSPCKDFDSAGGKNFRFPIVAH